MTHTADAGDYRGRPVLFLIGVLSLWVAGRAGIMMWNNVAAAQDTLPKVAARDGVKPVQVAQGFGGMIPITGLPLVIRPYGPPEGPPPALRLAGRAKPKPLPLLAVIKAVHIGGSAPAPFLHLQGFSLADVRAAPPVFIPARPYVHTTPPPPLLPSRWSGSAWALWRAGERAGDGGAALPLYGGSQVGARVAYGLDRAKALDLYLRASAPLVARTGKEVALGASVKPLARFNAAVAVEQRVRLDGAGKRTAPALLAYGGFGPRDIVGLEGEGYAQAGVVGIKNPIPFADGALTLTKPLGKIGAVPLRVGGGVWGGAQKGASRLDVGPRLSGDIPLSVSHKLRVAVDWRQRIGGAASPGSGLAFSIGTDF